VAFFKAAVDPTAIAERIRVSDDDRERTRRIHW
jgi:hypothetical protein